MEFKYAIPPTLLDNFVRFKKYDDEGSLSELMDKLNRIPREKTEENEKGILFETVINSAIDGINIEHEFDGELVNYISSKLSRCISKQKYIEAIIITKKGNVKLYGIFDYEFPEMIADLKTLKSYSIADGRKHFQDKSQHRFAFAIANRNGKPLRQFNYLATNFRNRFIETYMNEEKHIKSLHEDLLDFIGFIEHFKKHIDNPKLFGL